MEVELEETANINETMEFLTELMDKHHKGMVAALNGVASAMNSNRDKELISETISEFKKSIKSIVSEIKNIPQPEIEFNEEKIISAIEKMGEDITSALEKIKFPEIKEWEFKVVRDYDRVQKVIATAKK